LRIQIITIIVNFRVVYELNLSEQYASVMSKYYELIMIYDGIIIKYDYFFFFFLRLLPTSNSFQLTFQILEIKIFNIHIINIDNIYIINTANMSCKNVAGHINY
jgi:hypothetical protein